MGTITRASPSPKWGEIEKEKSVENEMGLMGWFDSRNLKGLV